MAEHKRPVAKWQPRKPNPDDDLEDITKPVVKKKEKKIRHQQDKWDDRFFLVVYQLAKEGKSHADITKAIGVDDHTLKSWRARKPALEEAYASGKTRNDQTFADYVYNKLPRKLQETWDKIAEFDEHPNALRKIVSLMSSNGKRERQHLFIHALINRNFNPTLACSSIGISYTQLLGWCRTDIEFGEMLKEIEWHRKNFYEDHLYQLVAAGNPAATIFVNKTKNQDRGYGAKLQVEHSGNVNHTHQVVNLDEMNLPLDLRRALLDHIEAHNIKALPAPKMDYVDASFEDISERVDSITNNEENEDAA